MSGPNRANVAGLLTFTADIYRLRGAWPDYVQELGLTDGDVEEIARLALDDASRSPDPDEPSFWATVHAWRALAQLRSPRAVEVLLASIDRDPDDDWSAAELPAAAEMVGAAAVPLLEAFLQRHARKGYTAAVAAEALCDVSLAHPATREQVVAIAASQLESYRDHDPAVNAFLVGCLLKNEAVEWLPLIEAAFSADAVDEMVYGDIHDIRFELGVGPKPGPRVGRWVASPVLPTVTRATASPAAGMAQAAATAKEKARAKGKAAKLARKKNRRR
jgi:hypothetical protein